MPAGRGANAALIAGRRMCDLVTVRMLRPRPDILHINYGVSGYYGWGRNHVVLHLHGTDVRQDLNSRVLGPVVRRSIATADAVLYSTPDMADAVHALRPDATWFPAPLPPAAGTIVAPTQPRTGRRVFFASRWDDSKGAVELVRAAESLRRDRPGLELLGLDWGIHKDQARAAGVTLLPHMPEDRFRAQLAGADVVVGQIAFGALGLADLEAMAQARPLVARFTLKHEYGSQAPLFNTVDADPATLVERILDDPVEAERIAERGRQWALEHHSAVVLEEKLEAIYAGLADRGQHHRRHQ
ncbi:glycosyltransferase [Specibacter cremeus]|uniref:glycosyltransferase n=1 Tax=Specibacter cremeus TaxID=1629051 RepID=UPI001F0C6835|nr:glycosyltransferase [Specibacter cremeus]